MDIFIYFLSVAIASGYIVCMLLILAGIIYETWKD